MLYQDEKRSSWKEEEIEPSDPCIMVTLQYLVQAFQVGSISRKPLEQLAGSVLWLQLSRNRTLKAETCSVKHCTSDKSKINPQVSQ